MTADAVGGDDINTIHIVSTGAGTTQLFALRVDGKIMLDSINESKKWSDDVTSTQGVENAPKGFDGNTSTYMNTVAANIEIEKALLRFAPATPLTVNTSLRIYIYSASNAAYVYQRYCINDGDRVNYESSSPEGSWKWVNTGFTGTLNSLEWTAKKSNSNLGGVDVAAIEIDGTVLVQPDSGGIASALGNTLSRTWEEWNTVGTLLASNPEDVELYARLKKAQLDYPGEKYQFRQELVTKMATNFSDAEIETVLQVLNE